MRPFPPHRLSDLDGVRRRSLANLVAADPEGQAVALGAFVHSDTADVNEILVRGVEGHGVALQGRLVHDLDARRAPQQLTGLVGGEGALRLDRQRLKVFIYEKYYFFCFFSYIKFYLSSY